MNFTEDSTSKFIMISNGYKLHFHDIGGGEPIIMLHGGGPGAGGWTNFKDNITPLVESGYRVILPDFPGFNKSAPLVTTDISIRDRNANAILDLMNALDIEKAHLLGNSMGGAAAVTIALENPDRVNRLVIFGSDGLTGPSSFIPSPQEGPKLLFEVFNNPSLDGLKKLLNIFVYDPSLITDDLVKERYDSMMLNDGIHLKNFIESAENSPSMYADISNEISNLEVKTLILWGNEDRFVALDNALRLVKLIPDSRLHIIGNCGHWAQLEHTDEFNNEVLAFLKL